MKNRPAAILAVTASSVLLIDQVSKALVRATIPVGASVPVAGAFLRLTHVRNTGAAFGLFPGHTVLFIGTALVVLAGIAWVWWRMRPTSPWLVTACGLIAAGALGNLIDRVVFGRVTDFFDVGIWPVFNVADIALDVGVAIALVWVVLAEREDA